MNALRIRVVQLHRDFGVGDQHVFAVQVSCDGLCWWTINRFNEEENAVEAAKGLERFIAQNRLVRATRILWKTQM